MHPLPLALSLMRLRTTPVPGPARVIGQKRSARLLPWEKTPSPREAASVERLTRWREELLDEYDLGSRMTAHKYITVADVFLEEHVRFIRGMEKAYLLIRWVRRRDANAEPRDLLAPGTKVLGKLVPELAARRAGMRRLKWRARRAAVRRGAKR